MKKATLLLLATGLLIGCSFMQNTTPGAAITYSKYPECQEMKGQAEWVQCVKDIQAKEGKIR